MKESLRHIADTNRVIARFRHFFTDNGSVGALACLSYANMMRAIPAIRIARLNYPIYFQAGFAHGCYRPPDFAFFPANNVLYLSVSGVSKPRFNRRSIFS